MAAGFLCLQSHLKIFPLQGVGYLGKYPCKESSLFLTIFFRIFPSFFGNCLELQLCYKWKKIHVCKYIQLWMYIKQFKNTFCINFNKRTKQFLFIADGLTKSQIYYKTFLQLLNVGELMDRQITALHDLSLCGRLKVERMIHDLKNKIHIWKGELFHIGKCPAIKAVLTLNQTEHVKET